MSSGRAGTPARSRFRESLEALSQAQKSGKGAPAYSRFVNRRLGRVLAAAAHVLGASPNAVTLVSGLFSFAGIVVVAFAPPSWALGVVVALLLVTGYALDAADGQLARLRGGGSVAGEWLDHMVDSVKITSLHLAVLVSLYRFSDVSELVLVVPIGFAIVGASSFFAQILNEQLRLNRAAGPGPPSTATPRSSVVASVLKVPTDYGLLCLVFVLLGWSELFALVYAALFVGSTAYFLLACLKWFADMQALDAASQRPA